MVFLSSSEPYQQKPSALSLTGNSLKMGTRSHRERAGSLPRRQRGTRMLKSLRYWLHRITIAIVLETCPSIQRHSMHNRQYMSMAYVP